MLQPIDDWRNENFTKPPTAKTVRTWCEKGEIAAKRIGKSWFVVVGESAKPKNRVDSMVNKVLG